MGRKVMNYVLSIYELFVSYNADIGGLYTAKRN